MKMKNKPIIIAEAGVNHDGNLSKAIKLIDLAKDSGADYVKFQLFQPDALVTKTIGLANYQKKNLNKQKLTQLEMLKKYTLTEKEFNKIIKYCKKKKIKFLATPFDEHSLIYLVKKKPDFIKLGSGDLDNFELLNIISKFKLKLILSTGISQIPDIRKTINFLKKKKFNLKNLYLLHCTSSYPTPLDRVNMRFIKTLKKIFKIKVGYSDHTKSLITGAIATSYGAAIIEKHVTLNKNSYGPDHKASLNFKEFTKYIENINETLKILGSDKKKLSIDEIKTKKLIQRFIVAKKDIKKNEILTPDNITCKRSLKGISSNQWFDILGKRSKKNFKIDDIIFIK